MASKTLASLIASLIVVALLVGGVVENIILYLLGVLFVGFLIKESVL